MNRVKVWYWRIHLFSSLVWRVDMSEARMSVKKAWDVARTIHD